MSGNFSPNSCCVSNSFEHCFKARPASEKYLAIDEEQISGEFGVHVRLTGVVVKIFSSSLLSLDKLLFTFRRSMLKPKINQNIIICWKDYSSSITLEFVFLIGFKAAQSCYLHRLKRFFVNFHRQLVVLDRECIVKVCAFERNAI